MSFRNTSNSFGSVAKFFHWVISPLVILMLAFGFFMEDVPEDYKGLVYNTHKLVGLTILFLMVLRLLWALTNPKPVQPRTTAPLLRLSAQLVHYALYLFVIVMAAAGWVGAVAGGRPPHLGDFMFSLPIEQDKGLAETAFTIHGYVAWVLIALVTVHVLAALYHHLVKKDEVLSRMLPGGKVKRFY